RVGRRLLGWDQLVSPCGPTGKPYGLAETTPSMTKSIRTHFKAARKARVLGSGRPIAAGAFACTGSSVRNARTWKRSDVSDIAPQNLRAVSGSVESSEYATATFAAGGAPRRRA